MPTFKTLRIRTRIFVRKGKSCQRWKTTIRTKIPPSRSTTTSPTWERSVASTRHAFPHQDLRKASYEAESSVIGSRYSTDVFRGIMPDSGATGISTAGRPQVEALILVPGTEIDRTTKEKHVIRFGKGTTSPEGTVTVEIPIGRIVFRVTWKDLVKGCKPSRSV